MFTLDQACFPSMAMVNLQQGKSVAMSEFQIGDQVQTGKGIVLLLLDLYV